MHINFNIILSIKEKSTSAICRKEIIKKYIYPKNASLLICSLQPNLSLQKISDKSPENNKHFALSMTTI